MTEESEIKIINIKSSNKASKLLPENKATECNVENFYDCAEFDWDSHEPNEGPYGETIVKGTKIGLCKLTKKPCLNAAEALSSSIVWDF